MGTGHAAGGRMQNPQMPLTGGCQCGAIRYQLSELPKLIYACHCTNCQRLTGAAFSMGIVVHERALRLYGPELHLFTHPISAAGDRHGRRWVCPTCGAWIMGGGKYRTMPDDAPRTIRAGTSDDTSWLKPNTHFWVRSAQSWLSFNKNVRCFDTQPDNVAEWFASEIRG
jgi:hypothetical protein